MSELIILSAGAALLLLAYRDLFQRRLPNVWVGVYAALFLAYAWTVSMDPAQMGWHAAIGVLAVMLTALLFAVGIMGGGDVKLWGALMLWAGPQGAVTALLIATLCGGLVGILGWGAKRILQHNRRPIGAGALRMLTASRGVPYGVALVVAGLHNLSIQAL